MKNIALIFGILLMGLSANATSPESEDNYRSYDGKAYIFVEGDVEFSIFPDGQFDFVYVGPQTGSQVTISSPNVNVSFNSGYDYETYVQYDDYGAVIQVEDVPIYYDYYGRITQAGNVDIQYNDRRIVRVGGLQVVYNNYGYYSHSIGMINRYNPYYVYRPWHVYYAPPIYNHCIVYDMPYRRYYSPVRYSYHDHVTYYKNRNHVAYQNGRRDFYNPGSRVYDKKGRSSVNKEYNPNRRNTMVASNTGRNNSSIRSNNTRSNTITRSNSTNSKGAATIDRNTSSTRSNSSSVPTRTTVNNGNTRNTSKSTNSENTVRSNNTRNVSTDRQVQSQQTRTSSSNNRSSSVSKRTTQAPQRETTSRSTINKSSAPSRSSSNTNTSRSTSSNSKTTTRGRG